MRLICITLPETPERTAAAMTHFSKREAYVDFIDGVHAKTFGLLTCHTYDRDHPNEGYLIPQKHVGLCLSHFLAWSIAWAYGDQFTIIMEDDCELAEDWEERLDKAIADAPQEFDMIYLGSCATADKPKEHVTGDLWRVTYPLCTHCVLIRRKALPVLLRTQRDIWAPIDLALYFRSLPELNVLTLLPPLASQRNQDLPA